MPGAPWTLRAPRADDLSSVVELLASCALPSVGVTGQFGDAYVLAESEARIVGVAGIEDHNGNWLLRSVAVAPHMRGRGVGDALVLDRLEWARGRHIAPVFLLTTSAADYFARYGFISTDRSSAPAAIAECDEFKHVCPSSATFMILAKGGAL